MAISNSGLAMLALFPGVAEYIERSAAGYGNHRLSGIVRNIRYARNATYVGIAITAIVAATGVSSCNKLLTFGTTTLPAALQLHRTTQLVRQLYLNENNGTIAVTIPPRTGG